MNKHFVSELYADHGTQTVLGQPRQIESFYHSNVVQRYSDDRTTEKITLFRSQRNTDRNNGAYSCTKCWVSRKTFILPQSTLRKERRGLSNRQIFSLPLLSVTTMEQSSLRWTDLKSLDQKNDIIGANTESHLMFSEYTASEEQECRINDVL